MKNNILKAVVVTIILLISILLIIYWRQIKIIYYTCKYKMVSDVTWVNKEQQKIIDKLVALNIKTSELPQNTGIRYQLINEYFSELSTFRRSEYKRNIGKYFGDPLISFYDLSNNEYLIYWEQYFVFDKEGCLIKSGMTNHMKIR